jgi:hypothetical protein
MDRHTDKEVEMGVPVLAGKKFLAVIRTTKWFDLGFEARLVFSFLIFRARTAKGKGTSQRSIAGFLGIDRGEAVPKALQALRQAGLARQDEDGMWWAAEPKGEFREFFGWQDKFRSMHRPWFARFKFFTIYFPTPKSRLTLRQIALYFLFWSLAYNKDDPDNDFLAGQSVKGFASLLCVSRPNIDESLEVLRSEGLIRYAKSIDGNDIGVRLFPIRAEQEVWFRDALEPRVSEATGRARYPGLFDDDEVGALTGEGGAQVISGRDAVASPIAGRKAEAPNADSHPLTMTKEAAIVPASPPCGPDHPGAGQAGGTPGTSPDGWTPAPKTAGAGPRCPAPVHGAGDDSDDGDGLPRPEEWTAEDQRSHEEFLRGLGIDPRSTSALVQDEYEALFHLLKNL